MTRPVEAVKENSKPVSGSDDIARVATISAGDEYIGKLIAEAMEKVSKDGVITVEESKTAETYLRLLRVCSLTEVTFLHIWLQIPTKWRLL